ncbi:hypothetical protein V5O48_018574 [Marasmius crinis-equi]|uniref:U3 small nucleolar RNA-associated protein 11 n=1 Tax=Marasmius crinis-equi TaxID=585013 RepID=A0ABR3EKV7_9AGAR
MARKTMKLTQAEVEKRRKVAVNLASKDYRARNREDYNRKARERMAKRRQKLKTEDPDKLKNAEQAHSRAYYHTHRQYILEKAETKRYREYRESHGTESFDRNYRFRDVRPRELLDLKLTDEAAYEEGLKDWQEKKRANRILEQWRSTENPSLQLMRAVSKLNHLA